jgi:transposase
MAAPVIFTDDTPIGVLAPGNRRTKTGRVWTYVVDERPWAGDRPLMALYRYSRDRKAERPAGHLGDFTGTIHADGYAGYEALTRSKAPPGQRAQRIVHAACWAHARRKLYDVYQKTQSPIAFEGLRRIGALYDIERDINGLPPERRHAIRAERTVPLLADLRVWMETERRRLSGKNDLAKALQYALGRWDALARFVDRRPKRDPARSSSK